MMNAVTFVATDGKTARYPLQWLLQRDAVIASEIGGQPLALSVGGFNQLWFRGGSGKQFLRDIISIRFTQEDEVPEPESPEAEGMTFTNRPNVSARTVDNTPVFRVGEPIAFEGYADDGDRDIVGLEFSLDDGENWTTYPTEGARAGRWVWWQFAYTPEVAGSYLLRVRSVNEQGERSPISATQSFYVA